MRLGVVELVCCVGCDVAAGLVCCAEECVVVWVTDLVVVDGPGEVEGPHSPQYLEQYLLARLAFWHKFRDVSNIWQSTPCLSLQPRTVVPLDEVVFGDTAELVVVNGFVEDDDGDDDGFIVVDGGPEDVTAWDFVVEGFSVDVDAELVDTAVDTEDGEVGLDVDELGVVGPHKPQCLLQ